MIEINQRKKLERLFEDELGIKIVKIYPETQLGINYTPDHYLVIKLGKYSVPVIAEFKGEVSSLQQVKKFAEFSKKFEGIGILVCEKIDNKIKEHLRHENIGFYEDSGDTYIPLNFRINKMQEDYSLVPKSLSSIIQMKGFRAESSIKLLVYLVSNPLAMEATQRELADKIAVALSTLNNALSNLEKYRIIITRGSERYFGNFEEIVSRARISIQDLERKETSYGRYSPIDDTFMSEWEMKNLMDLNSYWGGEAAAAIKTNYLSPENYKIYTYQSNPIHILKKLRLKKDPNGSIEILKCFWPDELNDPFARTIPDFVTYCDLLNSGNDRNIETALMMEDKIRKKIKKREY